MKPHKKLALGTILLAVLAIFIASPLDEMLVGYLVVRYLHRKNPDADSSATAS